MPVTGVDATGANRFIMERIYMVTDVNDGVIATGFDVHITNCYLLCITDGIQFSGDRTTITDCTINADTPIIITAAATCDDWKISNNWLAGSVDGIAVTDGLDGIIAHNSLDVQQHGISLTDTSRCLITGNLIVEPSEATDNTYDGIILAGNSDLNEIRDNKITGRSVANQPRYGINISAATCDDNSYLGNRTGPAADYGTGAYNDAGTGTINTWPGAAAPQGDNLL